MPDIRPVITEAQRSADPILAFFAYDHLPAALQSISAPFHDLAARLVGGLIPRNAERTVALRKILEAKDAAVRAGIGAVASGGSILDRLKTEQRELTARLEKLTEFLDGVDLVTQVGQPQLDLLHKQKLIMTEYAEILAIRIENIEHSFSVGQAREVGGHDEDRDGPVKFGD